MNILKSNGGVPVEKQNSYPQMLLHSKRIVTIALSPLAVPLRGQTVKGSVNYLRYGGAIDIHSQE